MRVILRHVRDEGGIETLEWILMGALITGVGLIVYPGTLTGQLSSALTAIGAAIVSGVGS
jgi:Flp pilus assembly pilin Flp